MIKFSEFMYNWLYADDGYYANYEVIGKDGDFFTAVSSSKYFGGAIAKRIIKTIEDGFLPEDTTIVEIGAHKGYLLADIIEFIYTLKPKLLETLNFLIVERFDSLKQKQLNYFQESFGDYIKLNHVESLEDIKLNNALVVANEIFDAFSCELIKDNQMAFVDEDLNIHFKDMSEDIKGISKKYNQSKGEVAVGFDSFAVALKKSIDRFEFITFDYGEKEVREDFSIRIYKNHEVFPFFEEELDLKSLYKNSDITFDVNFSHLIDSFKIQNIECVEYKTQLAALVEFGIMELLQILRDNVEDKIYLKELSKVKTLITPTVMGERFKMCRFRKDEK
jgi:SAM-dependent MidA family methyltransferase